MELLHSCGPEASSLQSPRVSPPRCNLCFCQQPRRSSAQHLLLPRGLSPLSLEQQHKGEAHRAKAKDQAHLCLSGWISLLLQSLRAARCRMWSFHSEWSYAVQACSNFSAFLAQGWICLLWTSSAGAQLCSLVVPASCHWPPSPLPVWNSAQSRKRKETKAVKTTIPQPGIFTCNTHTACGTSDPLSK